MALNPVNPKDLLAKASAKAQAQVSQAVSAIQTAPEATAGGQALYSLIRPYLLQEAGLSGESVESFVKQIITENTHKVLSVEITINHQTSAGVVPGIPQNLGVSHKQFPMLLKLVSARYGADHPKAGDQVNRCVYLPGPAGSGKTHAASMVAKALNLPFRAVSVNGATTEGKLIGFRNAASGEPVLTDLRECYVNGGVFLLDECDAGTANALAVLNMLIENDEMGFPEGMRKRHKDFYLLAAGNTLGYGADRVYVGRNELDGATLNRFTVLDWQYDTDLEAYLAGGDDIAKLWTRRVQDVRNAVATLELAKLVTPRQTMRGAEMIRQGILTPSEADTVFIASIFSVDEWTQITQQAGEIKF